MLHATATGGLSSPRSPIRLRRINTPKLQELPDRAAHYDKIAADSPEGNSDYTAKFALFERGDPSRLYDRCRADSHLNYQGHDAAGLVDPRLIDALRAAYLRSEGQGGGWSVG